MLSTDLIPDSNAKTLGRTALQMPALGFGAAPIGNLYHAMSDADAQATVAAALVAGIRYFDTAPHYGFGLSESRLGNALAWRRNEVVLSSKVGRLLVPTDSTERVRHGFADAPALEPVFDYSYDAVMRSFETSLARLQTDHIEILLAHDLGPMTHGEQHAAHLKAFLDGGYRAMHELRAAGVVAAIGLGANEWQICEEVLAHTDLDGFLLAGRYTLLEQSALDRFLPLCATRGVSILLGGPFNSGILASGVSGTRTPYYNYAPAPAEIIQRVARLESVCAEYGVALPAAALQFPGAHPQVCSVVAGLGSAAHVAQATQWMSAVIPEAFWARLKELELLHPDAPVPTIHC